MKDFWTYTLGRIGLLLVCYAVFAGLWALIFHGQDGLLIWPFVLAVIASSLLSLKFLKGPRERFAARVQERAEKATKAFDEMKAKEDGD